MLLKLNGWSEPRREWHRVGRFVFGQFNHWSFPSICRWPSFRKSYFLFPFLRCFISLHGRGQYVEGGTCKRFLSEERASHCISFNTRYLYGNQIKELPSGVFAMNTKSIQCIAFIPTLICKQRKKLKGQRDAINVTLESTKSSHSYGRLKKTLLIVSTWKSES